MTTLVPKCFAAVSSALFIVLVGLFGGGCDRPGTQQAKTLTQGLDTLANFLDATSANPLIRNFEGANGELNGDFFYTNSPESIKQLAIAFYLNETQADTFFADLSYRINNRTNVDDSVTIRILMAFRGLEGTESSGQSNLTPLLEVVGGKPNNKNSRFYPLRLLKADHGQRIISDSLTKGLMRNWENVPFDSITKQLYYYESSGKTCINTEQRVKYHTFEGEDTQDIYGFCRDHQGKFHFYLYLGQLQQCNDVPFRTILHITNIPLDARDATAPKNREETFEFSKPCPTYCPG